MSASLPAGPFILNTGQSSTNEEKQDLHADPYLFDPEAAQGWPVPDPAWKCDSRRTKVRGCGCGNKTVQSHCNKKKCVAKSCRDRLRNRAAGAIERRIRQGLNGRDLIYTVLPVPPRRRAKCADPDFWARSLRTLKRWLEKNLDFAWGVERSDPAGRCERANREDDSTCDCDRCRLWHPHINLLWVRNCGRGYIEPEKLEALKAKWRQILGEHPENPIVVYTQYARAHDDAKIRHLCSYMGRVWPRWNEQWKRALRVKWLGSFPKKPPALPQPCCDKCGLEVVTVECGSEVEAERVASGTYQQLLDFRDWRTYDLVMRAQEGRLGRIKRRIKREREMRGEE